MRRALAILISLGSCVLPLGGCKGEDPPDEIVFGQVTALSGMWAESVAMSTGPVYQMWIEELQDKGGLYISEYGKRIPVRFIKRDDESDLDKMKEELERLMLEDKVDFLLPPMGTTFLYEAAKLANKYGYILVGGGGGAIKLKEIISGLPYFFSVLNHADTQMPALAELYAEIGVQRVAVFFVNELHGIEYSGTLIPELAREGIDVVMVKSYEPTDPDVEGTLAEAMAEADALEADAFVGLTYPEATFPAPGVAMHMGYSPRILHGNVGAAGAMYRDMYGAEVVEGITSPGAWNSKTSKAAQEFEERLTERWPDTPVDYWGMLQYYAGCQFFEQAIEKAGTLDHSKIRVVMATQTFDTALGPMKFENGINVTHPGEIGQWQDGVFEVVAPRDKRTAEPIYPKPPWPAPPDAGAGGADGGGAAGAEGDSAGAGAGAE